ncbi:MAG: Gx transporter family protein [Clostridiales bacterium]|nr:Gx transporter family protein [Clostridiales bacterium]
MKTASQRAKRVALLGILLSLMLVLGWVEHMIPVPGMPGVKLGLSNSLLLFAVYMLDIPTAYLMMLLKVLLSGFLFGNPSSMMYAFAGGVVSLTAMALLSRSKAFSPVVVSMAGGVMHNVGQVVLAMIVLKTPGLLFYMAILMAVGLVTGLATGVAAKAVMKHLPHFSK